MLIDRARRSHGGSRARFRGLSPAVAFGYSLHFGIGCAHQLSRRPWRPQIALKRKLAHDNADGRRQIIGQDQIATFESSVVVLGDPGMGKSVLAETLGRLPGSTHYRAGAFVLEADPTTPVETAGCIVIDGLDEIASSAAGRGVETVLTKLSAMGKPRFVLTCREADWLGATDRIKIADTFGAEPIVLHLLPFERHDAQSFLSDEFADADFSIDEILDHLESRGLDDVYKNPLTLRLLGEVARDAGALPRSRADLIGKSCMMMLTEKNERHFHARHAKTHANDLLLAAGAACAALLLCDRIAIFDGAYGQTPDGHVNIGDVARLKYGEPIADALKTRLFSADGEGRFIHVHRVIAEYLGAKWLAHCFGNGASENRMFALLAHGDGVPTSLRGLHAWIAHFSSSLAPRCIAVDPYAVLRYGDAETLSLENAHSLLAALKRLSEEDPYFHSEDWGRHPISGLIRPELTDEILSTIGISNRHEQLSLLLLEAMIGTDFATQNVDTFRHILFDQDRLSDQRSTAAEVLHATGAIDDWESVVRRLLTMGDSNSILTAKKVACMLATRKISAQACAETVLAWLGLTRSPLPRPAGDREVYVVIRDSMFSELDDEQAASLLDVIAEYCKPLIDSARHPAAVAIIDLVRLVTVRLLQKQCDVTVKRLWSWIEWSDRNHYPNHDCELAKIFRENTELRRSLISHVLLENGGSNIRLSSFKLHTVGLGLYPTDDDLVSVLNMLSETSDGDGASTQLFDDLLQMARTRHGLSDAVRRAALKLADGNAELTQILTDASKVRIPDRELEPAERDAKAEAEKQEIFRPHREFLIKEQSEVAAGNFLVLNTAAHIYLGRNRDFDSFIEPEKRLAEFLGCTLARKVRTGFVAVLTRNDLPTATEIVEIYLQNKTYTVEASMICGAVEMIRRGLLLDNIDREILTAVLVAWHQGWRSPERVHVDIGPPIEDMLLKSDEDVEAYLRLNVEPWLARTIDHPWGLERMLRDARWARVAGCLAVDWLKRYRNTSGNTLRELLHCALKNAPAGALIDLVRECRKNTHPDPEAKRLWLATAYFVDFDDFTSEERDAAADDPDLIWPIRELMEADLGEASLHQLTFYVEEFGRHWPRVESTGDGWGDRSAWDASISIRNAIDRIAETPNSDATKVLERLVETAAPSYRGSIQHALTLQRRSRRDQEHVSPTVEQLHAAVTDAPPESIDDMRAFFADRIEELQKRLHGSDTDIWRVYWIDDDSPQGETYCRDRIVDQLREQSSRWAIYVPENQMPKQTRADIIVTRNSIGLPVEIKGQWHREVWDAAISQLDAQYTIDWRAQGRGAYLVLWFGDVPTKQLQRHPEGLERPKTPASLRRMLAGRIPEERRSQIDVFVLDVTGLAKPA